MFPMLSNYGNLYGNLKSDKLWVAQACVIKQS